MRSTLDNSKIIQLYEANKSTHEIAEELGTYPNKVRRALIKAGYKPRNKSEAQSVALATGRHEHPTKGKHRDDKTKLSIAEGVHKYWQEMSEEEYDKRVAQAQAQWAAMSEAEKEELRTLAAEAVREAAKNGSKIENFVRNYLQKVGFHAIFRKKGLISDEELEIDIYIPSLKTAIEIDGPAHFLPIWGEENLQKHIRSDAKKTGLLIGSGYCLIRLKCIRKHISDIQMLHISQIVEQELQKIEKCFPSKTKRLIQIEV